MSVGAINKKMKKTAKWSIIIILITFAKIFLNMLFSLHLGIPQKDFNDLKARHIKLQVSIYLNTFSSLKYS